MFGLLNGLPPQYYAPFRAAWISPLPLELLKSKGYRVSFRYTSDMKYDGLVDLYFSRTGDEILHYDDPIDDKQERRMFDDFRQALREADRSRPRFDYYVAFASHYPYLYPPRFEIFTPVAPPGLEKSALLKLSSNASSVRNRFHNAVRFVDEDLSLLFETLRRTGRLDDTIVVIAGDHGEEFWEKGQFGHTNGLTNEQVQTVFVVFFGQRVAPSKYEYSSHQDLMPTLFDFMEADLGNDWIFAGKSLLRHDEDQDFAVTSKGIIQKQKTKDYAIIGDGLKVLFTMAPDPVVRSVFTDDDLPVASPDAKRVERLMEKAGGSTELRLHGVGGPEGVVSALGD